MCALFLASCAGTYYGGYRFDPRPTEVVLEVPGAQDLPRALFRVAGVRRADADAGRGPELVVDVRLENPGESELVLERDALTVVSGNLTELGPMRQEPAGPLVAPPGEARKFQLSFALPAGSTPGDLELDGMNLRWALSNAKARATGSISFARIDPYDDPYWPRGYGGYAFGGYGWICY
ncbi:MAG TPA: hypothetical protein ENJ09_04535 [Planctomycetes bacterium]|nr:hypothetical protein [Planctomycetota bacterium]